MEARRGVTVCGWPVDSSHAPMTADHPHSKVRPIGFDRSASTLGLARIDARPAVDGRQAWHPPR
jgi:hypothetical protein